MLLSSSFLDVSANLLYLILNSSKGIFLSGLVPVFYPSVGADAERVLSESLAFLFVSSGLLQAKKPLIVAVPAVKSLVLGRKSLITRSGANVLNLVQQIFFLLAQGRDLVAENLRKKDENETRK